MSKKSEICTLNNIDYVITSSNFGFIGYFIKNGGEVFSTGDTYVADTETATPYKKATVFDKMSYCMRKSGQHSLEDIKSKKVRVSFDNGKFLGFWFIEENE